MIKIIKLVDTISEISGRLCAWMFFVVGFFVTFEVLMRYVFTDPTLWVDETSRVMLVWATYLASAYVLKHRNMITVEILLRNPDSLMRKLAETLAVIMLLIFSGTATYYGFQLWLKSTLAGHTTDTFLALPKWLTHAPVWLGMGLLSLQGLVELYRVWNIDITGSAENRSSGEN